MDATGSSRWLRTVILLGAVYVVVGVTCGALAGGASSHQMRTAWRLAAWVISAAAFAAHIWYEHARVHSSSSSAAFHVSLAAALGAFGLAVAANVHRLSNHQPGLILALVAWPVLTGVPAFLVAYAAAAGLGLRRPRV
jgi:hypothetical protein